MVGNWKMALRPSQAHRLAQELAVQRLPVSCDIVVCPSFTALSLVRHSLGSSRLILGAQDVFGEVRGEHTGAVAVGDLREFGCRYVILGHSERRRDVNETDAEVNKKCLVAIGHGLSPIVCVGESRVERQRNIQTGVVARQVLRALHNLPPPRHGQEIVIAYEPIWAVGAEEPAEPEEVMTMAAVVHQALVDALGERLTDKHTRIVYGGSVFPDNVRSFIDRQNIHGVLLGRASQNVTTLVNLLKVLG